MHTTHPHTFHIPVMGTSFTLDTPLRVARYGITSVVSLVDDVIIENARKFHCQKNELPYEAIQSGQPDARARRITAYLNLLGELVDAQFETLKQAPFSEDSEITRYFELLPDASLKRAYRQMLSVTDQEEKTRLQDELRSQITPGKIDVNIMTKLDADNYDGGAKLAPEYADGMAALRGFAQSNLSSAMVFSAGFNPRLYSYAATFDDFFFNEEGQSKKKIIIKVSDYRSALIQGKFLAKRGLWVHEFRIESGINCGGHAFANECNLMGPVLEEFKNNRTKLVDTLFKIYVKALTDQNRPVPACPPNIRVTVQGGIGTAHEDKFLLQHFSVDGTGWGTPFMLVPEVTNVDPEHLEKIINANPDDVFLSNCSPVGVPFWNLRTSASEESRRLRIQMGKPGSPCIKGYLSFNSDFTDKPVCIASREYISKKLQQLSKEGLPTEEEALLREDILSKSCICHDLGGAVSRIQTNDQKAKPAICCGPNIRNFHRIFSLDEMVDHIYGRICLIVNSERPHMFIEEMRLNLDFLREEIKKFSYRISNRPQTYFESFKTQLLSGIDYYRELAKQTLEEQRERFLDDLKKLKDEIERTCLPQQLCEAV